MKKLIVSLMLIAMSAFAAESAPSAKVGYVKYPCVVGNTFVALPMQDTYTTASTLHATNFNAVYRYLPATQKWDGATKTFLGWSNNFTVTAGQSYWVSATVATDFIVDGGVVTNPAYSIVVGNNAVMLPLTKSTMTTASTYGTEIPTVNAVYRYLTATQKWDGATKTFLGWSNNFTTSIADPHWISSTGTATWPGTKSSESVTDEIFVPKGNPKNIVFGMKDRFNNEYDATTITGVTFKAWMTQGTGAAPTAEILNHLTPGCATEMFFGVRGISKVDLQNFGTWGLNNILNILMKDENDGLKVYYEASATWLVNDLTLGEVDLGFEDLGLPGSGQPWLLNNPSSIEDGVLPAETKLHQNYPNPFNPTTTIKFDLAKESVVKLNVYNYNGQLVRSLVDGQMNAGYHSVNFDASSLSAGVYYYTMETAGMTKTHKMVLVK